MPPEAPAKSRWGRFPETDGNDANDNQVSFASSGVSLIDLDTSGTDASIKSLSVAIDATTVNADDEIIVGGVTIDLGSNVSSGTTVTVDSQVFDVTVTNAANDLSTAGSTTVTFTSTDGVVATPALKGNLRLF